MKKLLFVLLCMLLIPAGVGATMSNLPVTGQTTSYTVGDDGDTRVGLSWPTVLPSSCLLCPRRRYWGDPCSSCCPWLPGNE